MEYGRKREDDRSICQDFPASGGEYQHNGSPAYDTSDLMEDYPPAANENHYNNLYHQGHNQTRQQQNCSQPQTLGTENGGQFCNIEREHMFDKVVTPSDVGKLNRLVIPKQHAEKYFPLDSSSNAKGLLLNFEDLTGKAWRFRYSYWNSSQSYVMTKGWSRFVKEKKLYAGDIVSFHRGVADKHRLLIDWRRRPITQLPFDMSYFHNQFYRSTGGIIPSWSSAPNKFHPDINFQIQNPCSNYYSGYGNVNYMGQVVTNNSSVVYLTTPERIEMVRGREGLGGSVGERTPVVFESVPVVQVMKQGSGIAKTLRLFGVNMECPVSSDTSISDEVKIFSSSLGIPLNIPPTAHHLNQYASSSALMLPSTTSRMYNDTLISNKGKKSKSLDLEI